jgi:hypothetical protein
MIPMRMRRASASGGAVLLCGALLCACGSAGGAAKAAGPSSTGTSTVACVAGPAATGTSVTAVQEPDAGVNKPNGPCWAKIAPTTWSNAVIGTTPAGTSTEFKVAWSPTYLYVWSQVKLGRAPICTDPSASWNDDSIEVYVSATNDQSDTSGLTAPGTGQFVVNACGENNQGAQGAALGTDHTAVNITSKSNEIETQTSTGYTTLLELAWSDLTATPKSGMVLGFSIGCDFSDPSTANTRLAQTMWAGNNYNYENDTDWGTLKLQ